MRIIRNMVINCVGRAGRGIMLCLCIASLVFRRDLVFRSELCAKGPEQNNMKGITIAIFCIFLILLTVALSIVYLSPKDSKDKETERR